MSQFKLHILGCGSAKPTLHHLPSCQVVDFRGKLFMIDCGEGAQLSFARQRLNFNRLGHIFISHLHGDHCFGLIGLLSTMQLHGHGGTITVHIFDDGARLIGSLCDYFCRESPFNVVFDVMKYGTNVVYDDDTLRITTIPLKHRVPDVGFLFEEKEKPRHINAYAMERNEVPLCYVNSLRAGNDYVSPDGVVIPNEVLTLPPSPSVRYAYVSDTLPTKKVFPLINDVDWLYHEATYAHDLAAMAKSRYHTTARQAAEIAREANARNLILGHFSSRYDSKESLLLDEAKAIFPGTILAREGATIQLDK